MKKLMLFIGVVLLLGAEMLRVYLIMPFPGSQRSNTVLAAYWISRNIFWIRLLAAVILILPVIDIVRNGSRKLKIVCSLIAAFYVIMFVLFNFKFEADKMFYQPRQKAFSAVAADTTNRNRLVIGVSINGEAKAYPIQLIGYHHQVVDTLGRTPVMITYCTVCRTGRVFSPFVNGKMEWFRQVGMDHFNAMFEDVTTKSWWRQATGVAVAGPLKGCQLKELPSSQMTLSAWLRQYPSSLILQPDSSFRKNYADLADYDNGTTSDRLEKRDSLSWQPKSWIVGVVNAAKAKAYDWNYLVKEGVINDSASGRPVLLALESDTASFHVFDRKVNESTLVFQKAGANMLTDVNTHSTWNMEGVCIEGAMKGERLQAVQSYQEFWHSWSAFHPGTSRFPE